METETYSYKALAELNIDIPAVQRGLVWKPEQVGNLWDSIADNIPIGSFLAYRSGEKLQLLDGQQRYTAIRYGINCALKGKSSAEYKFRIWVAIDKTSKGSQLIFMTCSESHPWGYTENYDVFSYEDRDDYNRLLKGETKDNEKDFFATATLSQSYPMLGVKKNMLFVPLAYALNSNGWSLWQDGKIFRGPREVLALYPNGLSIEKSFKEIQQELNALKMVVENTKIPIHIIENAKDEQYIQKVFSRINTGGTPLSREDEKYSALCVILGADIKRLFETLSKGFMPPARLANWAVRLYLLREDKEKTERSILQNVSEANYRYVMDQNNREKFVSFCFNQLGAYRELITNIYKFVKNKNESHVPPLVYLEHHDDNWISCIAWMKMQFSSLFEDSTHSNEAYYPLLGMLPDIICARSDKQDKFINAFYTCLNDIKSNSYSLLQLIAYGCAYAAQREGNSFVFPYPSNDCSIREIAKRNVSVIEREWNWLSNSSREIKAFIPYTRSRFILYYIQRLYLSKILSNQLRPEAIELWGEGKNRPFDIDHIIPKSYWPDEYMTDCIPNQQIYYYRHNRSKSDNYCGIRNNDSNDYDKKVLFAYPTEEAYKGCTRSEGKDYTSFKNETVNRWIYMMEIVYKSLRIYDLIQCINDFHTNPNDTYPEWLTIALTRYKQMKALKEEMGNMMWASISYRGLSRSNDIGMFDCGTIDDFYHSLVTWLSVGRPSMEDGIQTLKCLTWGAWDNYIEIGKRRGVGISPYLDHANYSKWKMLSNGDEWWLKCERLLWNSSIGHQGLLDKVEALFNTSTNNS